MSKKGPNVILLVVDALRARNLGCYGYSRPTSPNIDNLACEGVLFEDAYCCNVTTDSSLTTIFSGKYPLSHGILSHGEHVSKEEIARLNKLGVRFLSEILRSKGYATLAIDWLGRWHKKGFDYYSGTLHRSRPIKFPIKSIDVVLNGVLRNYAYLRKRTIIDDAGLVTKTANYLISRYAGRKFFLFIHYWDTHAPYAPPINFYKNIDDSMGKALKRIVNSHMWRQRRIVAENLVRYDAAIAYVDHEIGKLLETLENYGIREKTLIVLTSDHGESLGEHQIYFLHHCLYDPSIHVPLILSYPGHLPKRRRVKGFVQHFDLLPTVIDIIGLKPEKSDGKSLTPLIDAETDELHPAIYVEEAYYQKRRAIRTHDYKYIRLLSEREIFCKHCKRIHGGSVEELYDLREDPEEAKNIINEKWDVVMSLRKTLSEWVRHFT